MNESCKGKNKSEDCAVARTNEECMIFLNRDRNGATNIGNDFKRLFGRELPICDLNEAEAQLHVSLVFSATSRELYDRHAIGFEHRVRSMLLLRDETIAETDCQQQLGHGVHRSEN
jgi:hypothetical protein